MGEGTNRVDIPEFGACHHMPLMLRLLIVAVLRMGSTAQGVITRPGAFYEQEIVGSSASLDFNPGALGTSGSASGSGRWAI